VNLLIQQKIRFVFGVFSAKFAGCFLVFWRIPWDRLGNNLFKI